MKTDLEGILAFYNFKGLKEFCLERFNVELEGENIFVKLMENHKSNDVKRKNTNFSVYFKTVKWKQIFQQLGQENSWFLLKYCYIVERINGSLIQLTGNIYNLYEKSFGDKKILKRTGMYLSTKKIPTLEVSCVIEYIIDKVDFSSGSNTLNNITRESMTKILYFPISKMITKFNQIPIKHLFKEYFKKNEVGKVNLVDPNKIASFCLLLSTKFLSPIFDKKEFKPLKGKLILLLMRNKHEAISLNELTAFLSVRRCKLFKGIKEKINGKESKIIFSIFEKFLLFLFEEIFVKIISYFFYITTSNQDKLKLLYHHNREWLQRADKVLVEHLSKFKHIRTSAFINVPTAEIRCIVKNDDFRIITNCSKMRAMKFGNQSKPGALNREYFYSINSQSSIVTQMFKEMIKNLSTTNLCNGGKSVYYKLQSYLKKQSVEKQQYLFKFDIKNCYHSINQRKLISLIKKTELIGNQKYYIYQEVKSIVHRSNLKTSYFIKDKYCQVKGFENNKNELDRISKTVRKVEIEGCDLKKEIIKKLRNVHIEYKKQIYRVTNGIPQGWCLSPFLCSFYIQSVFLDKIDFIKNGVLLNFADDFLLITPDLNELKSLVSSLEGSNNQITFSKEKFDFNTKAKEFIINKTIDNGIIEEKNSINWCGLKIFDNGFAVKNQSIFNSLSSSVCILSSNPVKRFHIRIIQTLKKRLHTFFYDKRNSKVLENIFDLSLHTFLKMKIFFKRMLFINKNLIESQIIEIYELFKKHILKNKTCSIYLFYKIFRKSLIESNLLNVERKLKFDK